MEIEQSASGTQHSAFIREGAGQGTLYGDAQYSPLLNAGC
jgi:hypothetical protein